MSSKFFQERVSPLYDGVGHEVANPNVVDKIKQFKFTPGIDMGPNVDILPPPMFTHMSLPFNYHYSQNPYVRATEDGGTVNTTAVKQVGYFIGAEDPSPERPQLAPDLTDPRMVEVMAELEAAFEVREVWTRRSLLNHLGGKLKNWNELKKYLNYAAYQFKGGPWRDGVVPYGIDPRTDPKYRIYQTLMFKLPKQKRAQKGQTWKSLRKVQMGPLKEFLEELSESHVFDGDTYHTDGKVWQVCDIVDPLLKELFDNAAVRPEWDPSSGWYHGGLWAKVKAIMKTKLVAIQFDRRLSKEDFALTLQTGDQTPVRENQSTFHLPLPNLRLTDEELTQLRGRQPTKKNKHKGYSVRVRDPNAGSKRATGPSSAADSQTEETRLLDDMEVANDESGSDEDDEDDSGDEDAGMMLPGIGEDDGDADEEAMYDESRMEED